MNEVFAIFDAQTLIDGIISLASALISIYLILVGYRYAKKALGEGSYFGDDDPDFAKGQAMIDESKGKFSGPVLTEERWTIMQNEYAESSMLWYGDDEARDSD